MSAGDAEMVDLDLTDLGDPEEVARWEAEQKERQARWKAKEKERQASEAIKQQEREAAEAIRQKKLEAKIAAVREAQRAEQEKAEAEKRETARIEEEWRRAPNRISLGPRSYAVEQWEQELYDADVFGSSSELNELLAMVKEGIITDRQGRRLHGAALDRMRHRLLGTYLFAPLSAVGELGNNVPGNSRWAIPGVWPWGTFPQVAGPKKGGRTLFMIETAAALVVPDHRFLGWFPPAEIPDEERERGIVIFNSEVEPRDFEGALMRAGIRPDDPEQAPVWVVHLQLVGGPSTFDLIGKQNLERWENWLTSCESCDGSDDTPPFAVLADSVTAMVQHRCRSGEHKPQDFYEAWFEAFRHRLARRIDLPNGLASVHGYKTVDDSKGDDSGQQADGEWFYTVDPKTEQRYFLVRPRLGGVPIAKSPVDLTADGRLILRAVPETVTAVELALGHPLDAPAQPTGPRRAQRSAATESSPLHRTASKRARTDAEAGDPASAIPAPSEGAGDRLCPQLQCRWPWTLGQRDPRQRSRP
jgi:hypothetical protein